MTDGESSCSDPGISIIVPVFNVVGYIEEGLQSLAQQDFTGSFEVILVDDCSTDGSIEICRRFVQDYPDMFSLFESEANGGVSVARNIGLDQARGQYLMFFDPDDVLPCSALERMFEVAERYRADIVKGNLSLFDDGDRRPAPDRVLRTTQISGADVLTALFDHTRIRGHIGGKMYRRERFAQIRFTVGVRMAQDLLFFSEMFASARSLVLLAEEVYRYRKHQTGSTGRKYEKGSYIDWLSAVENSGEFASTNHQKRAHKGLQVRTLGQIARECRKIPTDHARSVLDAIDQKCHQWELGIFQLIFCDRLGLRTLSRYIKLQLALRHIRRNLSRN